TAPVADVVAQALLRRAPHLQTALVAALQAVITPEVAHQAVQWAPAVAVAVAEVAVVAAVAAADVNLKPRL
ncbi:MAG: hypothetical protein K2G64_03860, partial [Muribaculaceae bacterium]|nr:hypothetical protein [Muribaculaceae bacterium]